MTLEQLKAKDLNPETRAEVERLERAKEQYTIWNERKNEWARLLDESPNRHSAVFRRRNAQAVDHVQQWENVVITLQLKLGITEDSK